MWHKVRTALSLPASDLWILAQAWILLLLVDLGLRWLPFKFVMQWLRSSERFVFRKNSKVDPAHFKRLSHLVKLVGRNHLYEMTCLRQALVLRRLLLMENIVTQLQIGVRKEAGSISAHAWLEENGNPLEQSENPIRDFNPLLIIHDRNGYY